jgi:hypothetical protein
MAENHLHIGLKGLLLTKAAVTALVGTRIRFDQLTDKDPLPALVVDVQSEESESDLSGAGGLITAIVEFRAVAATKAAAADILEAIRTNGTDPGTGLAGYTGVAVDADIRAAWFEGREFEAVDSGDGKDSALHVGKATYLIQYVESV